MLGWLVIKRHGALFAHFLYSSGMGVASAAAEAEMAAAAAVAAAVATAAAASVAAATAASTTPASAASVAAATAASTTPASAIAAATSEPARAHAADLVLLGHLIASQLSCSLESDFAKVWKNVVVPVAAASRTDWQVGMCAEITASLVGRVSAHTLPAGTVGRIASEAPDGERWQLLVDGPRGVGRVDIKP